MFCISMLLVHDYCRGLFCWDILNTIVVLHIYNYVDEMISITLEHEEGGYGSKY